MDCCMLIGYLSSEISIIDENRFYPLAAWLTVIFFRLYRKIQNKQQNIIIYTNIDVLIFLSCVKCIFFKKELKENFKIKYHDDIQFIPNFS